MGQELGLLVPREATRDRLIFLACLITFILSPFGSIPCCLPVAGEGNVAEGLLTFKVMGADNPAGAPVTDYAVGIAGLPVVADEFV